jgi:acyl-coenzyme A thioesterase PaaI-like protein
MAYTSIDVDAPNAIRTPVLILGATEITATAAEINQLHGGTAGVASASKVLVVGVNKQLDELHLAKLFLGAAAGTEVLATAAELNVLAGLASKAVTDGTIKTGLKLLPAASAAVDGVNYHKLTAFGDVTGNTAFGMGDPTKPTTGLMACYGRTVLATGTFTDTGADVRVINKLVDTTGVHGLQALYAKAKNYAGATLTGDLVGLFVETVKDGTVNGVALGVKIGSDGTVLDGDIQFSNGARLVALTTEITANTTTTAAPAGSLGFTTHATGVGKWFVSDGSKWQYASVSA